MHTIEIRWNWFRGDDDLFPSCDEHRDPIKWLDLKTDGLDGDQ